MATEEDIRIFERLLIDKKSAKTRRKMAEIIADLCDATEARKAEEQRLEWEQQRQARVMEAIKYMKLPTGKEYAMIFNKPLTAQDVIQGTPVPEGWVLDPYADVFHPKELTIEEIKAKNRERSRE